MNANVWDVVEPIQTLIRGGRPVDPERLADPSIAFDDRRAHQP
jgi:3-phenylpropionate/trans-cinnamate dioxygenase ferredoxin reductase component